MLDLVNLSVGETIDYPWDAAGNLDSVAPGGNLIDFTFDDASRLAGADRTSSGGGAASFLYDGRGFLRDASQTAGGTASVTPLYDSAGLLHALRRQPSPTDPVDTTYVFYLAGRPVARLEINGTGAETWTYLTTDHLGTPLVATDQTGAITWEGGFEPFGTDYQAGTGNGASDYGIPLRLPGQWVSDVWANATSGVGIYQNAWRFLETQTGRYTRPDPLGLRYHGANPYAYGRGNPVRFVDRLGLVAWSCNVGQIAGADYLAGAGFFVDCDTGCVNGKRIVASYGILSGGLGEGAALPFELGYWDLEDGAATADPHNLEGPFTYRGCSISILAGVSYSEVHQGKGVGTPSFTPAFGFGLGCSAVTGGSKLLHTQEGCCTQGNIPIIRAR